MLIHHRQNPTEVTEVRSYMELVARRCRVNVKSWTSLPSHTGYETTWAPEVFWWWGEKSVDPLRKWHCRLNPLVLGETLCRMWILR